MVVARTGAPPVITFCPSVFQIARIGGIGLHLSKFFAVISVRCMAASKAEGGAEGKNWCNAEKTPDHTNEGTNEYLAGVEHHVVV